MQGVISAPKGIITGAFNIRLAFIREIELTAADIHVETLEGHALGHPKDTFGGSGPDYHILCYPPEGRQGKSRISVVKEGFEVPPVIVEYDTVRTVRATWGTAIQRGAKVEIPISFRVAIENLNKRNFRLSPPGPYQLYGTENAYSLVVQRTVRRISISGTVRKANGLKVEIVPSVIGVEV